MSRAYSGGVKHLLETLPTVEKVERVSLQVVLSYSEVDNFRRLAEESDVLIEEEAFAADVSFVVGVPSADRATFEAAVAELTQGRARIEPA